MEIIHEYEQNFNRIFDEKESMLINFLEDSKKSLVLSKIEEIREAKAKIQEILNKKDLLEDKALELVKINTSIKNLSSDKLKIKNRQEQQQKDILKIKDEIRNLLLTFDAELEA